ncbi:hypothetical protein IFM89_022682 [Coptis chinensis]|uniref:PGG domain-containing protein n=1 Tax=Coptis chinensis TaxID=261450 RepID=A0A835HGL3_9MAGN|nr:hypothetical protein IFM89_022682 [Coptis chinensis]
MAEKLLEAARTGNTGMLFELLDENPLVLATFAIGSRETLLHIASMFGHVDFIATLIIKLHPSSALELNQDGYSPMHISSTQGHRETVEFFIEFGRFHSILNEFCLQKNIHGRIPLHCAVSKGRVGVMGALLIACPESVQQLTDERETVLHLAVRNNQREAFSFLIQQPSIKALVNFMDDEGNTILHLATVCRQHQIVSFLLKETNVNASAMNSRGLTALEVLLMTPSQSNDIKLGQMLRDAGGEISQNHEASSIQVQVSATDVTSSHQTENSTKKKGKEMVLELRNGIMMMASLTASMTFQASLSPPGGFWQDWSDNTTSNSTIAANTTSPPAHKPGTAVIYDLNHKEFTSFLLWDAIGFLASLSIILSLIVPMPFKNDSVRWAFVRSSIYVVVLSVQFVFLEAIQLTTKKIYQQKTFAVFLTFVGLWLSFGSIALSHGFSLLDKKEDDNSSESD